MSDKVDLTDLVNNEVISKSSSYPLNGYILNSRGKKKMEEVKEQRIEYSVQTSKLIHGMI